MALDITKNFAKVTVSTGYAAGATSIVLQSGDGAKLPDPATDGEFNLVWWNKTDYWDPSEDPSVEIVRVTARTSDTITVTRGQESTSDASHNTASKTYQMILSLTKKMIDDLAVQFTTRIVSTAYTAAEEGTILVDASSGDVTITLPVATEYEGRMYTIKKTDSSANSIIIDGNAAETIDGELTQSTNVQYTAIKIVSNGSNWLVI